MALFHVCWERSSSGPLKASAYRILDSNNKTVYRRDSLSNDTNYAVNLTTVITSSNRFTIQALSPETVPSATSSFTVSG